MSMPERPEDAQRRPSGGPLLATALFDVLLPFLGMIVYFAGWIVRAMLHLVREIAFGRRHR